jgi:hypothetical protein
MLEKLTGAVRVRFIRRIRHPQSLLEYIGRLLSSNEQQLQRTFPAKRKFPPEWSVLLSETQ